MEQDRNKFSTSNFESTNNAPNKTTIKANLKQKWKNNKILNRASKKSS